MTGHEFELREQDRWLPIANVARLMKNTLPTTAKVSKDAKECMQECVSEFISFVTSEASDRCLMEKRKTINGEDVLYSLHTLGFENYAEVLKIYLAKYRQQQALRQERGEIKQKKKKKKNEDSLNHDNQSNIKQEENPNEIFEYPMDESMTVIRGNIDEIQRTNKLIKGNEISDNNKTKNEDKTNSNNNPTFDDPYVSQLYEQEYAGVPLHISNPDYKGSASESISMKRSHMKHDNNSGDNDNNNDNNNNDNNKDVSNSNNLDNKENTNDNNNLLDGNIVRLNNNNDDNNSNNNNSNNNNNNIEDNVNINTEIPLDTDSIGLSLDDDNNVGVGVNVHLGNTESLDEINSRLNRDVNENVIDGNNLINDDLNNDNELKIEEKSDNEIFGHHHHNHHGSNNHRDKTDVTKTPATTSTSDLLLLNDNITGISESEEIVGLANGHSGMYRFE